MYRKSDFRDGINEFVEFGDHVLCDGAWRHEGAPLLTRFTDTDYYTAAELAFNYVLSERLFVRIIMGDYIIYFQF